MVEEVEGDPRDVAVAERIKGGFLSVLRVLSIESCIMRSMPVAHVVAWRNNDTGREEEGFSLKLRLASVFFACSSALRKRLMLPVLPVTSSSVKDFFLEIAFGITREDVGSIIRMSSWLSRRFRSLGATGWTSEPVSEEDCSTDRGSSGTVVLLAAGEPLTASREGEEMPASGLAATAATAAAAADTGEAGEVGASEAITDLRVFGECCACCFMAELTVDCSKFERLLRRADSVRGVKEVRLVGWKVG